jgi:hypothetical protein
LDHIVDHGVCQLENGESRQLTWSATARRDVYFEDQRSFRKLPWGRPAMKNLDWCKAILPAAFVRRALMISENHRILRRRINAGATGIQNI